MLILKKYINAKLLDDFNSICKKHQLWDVLSNIKMKSIAIVRRTATTQLSFIHHYIYPM